MLRKEFCGLAGDLSRRYEPLVVARHAESSQRPVDEEEAAEDRVAWYRPEGAAVLRDAPVVAEDVVLLGVEVRAWSG
jgi:hypothetical protein